MPCKVRDKTKNMFRNLGCLSSCVFNRNSKGHRVRRGGRVVRGGPHFSFSRSPGRATDWRDVRPLTRLTCGIHTHESYGDPVIPTRLKFPGSGYLGNSAAAAEICDGGVAMGVTTAVTRRRPSSHKPRITGRDLPEHAPHNVSTNLWT